MSIEKGTPAQIATVQHVINTLKSPTSTEDDHREALDALEVLAAELAEAQQAGA